MKYLSANRTCSTIILALSLAVSASAQYRNRDIKLPPGKNMSSECVKTGLCVISGEGNNSILRLSGNGLILVDDKLPGNYEGLLGRAQKISGQPVRFLILTNVSKSNTGNLEQFVKQGTRIIAQDATAQELLSEKVLAPEYAAAVVRFDREHTVHLGGIEVQALSYGPAYSSGDTVVYFPNLKSVAIGGLYSSSLELGVGGSLVNWSSVLGQVLKLDFDTAIPATGPAISKAELQSFKDKIDILVAGASAQAK
jgi:hypothetical protein